MRNEPEWLLALALALALEPDRLNLYQVDTSAPYTDQFASRTRMRLVHYVPGTRERS